MFDIIYWVLVATMALLLLATVIGAPHRWGAGPALVALGFVLILAAGVGFRSVRRVS